MIEYIHDVTERKQMENELIEARNLALFASRAKSEFIANTSHELRSPMNAILGFSEILLSGKHLGELNETQKDYIKDILSSGNHLLSIINGILDISKVESGKMELYMDNVSI